ncbi:MAG: hypothetical protein OEM82_14725, partial [Acidobacteriota bacterium]|nr:hypothetical protein [Acidobacteriota bacterium]
MGTINKKIIGFASLLAFWPLILATGTLAQDAPDLKTVRASAVRGKRPLVIIPGILGSELVNKHSGEKVWFNLRRSKVDDLKLPVSPAIARSRDNLVPGDILRSIKFLFASQDFYGGFTESVVKYGDYEEASFDKPPASLNDKVFVFPYDWRRDNVETARLLVRKLAALKKASGEKEVKFDIVAHSMGGLIARYAAMYGDRDLPVRRPRPNWRGAVLINSIHMFGTPNHGAADSFQVLLEGFGAVKGINLPFVRDLSPVEVFTMPALFQLLPHSDVDMFYDEDLKPLKVDIYNYRTWEKYRWSIYGEDGIFDRYTEGEIARMEQYLEAVLKRARAFQGALDAGFAGPVRIVSYGSDCTDTADGYLLLKRNGTETWTTLTRPQEFTNSRGEKVGIRTVRSVMIKPGDGRVARRSVLSGLP